MSDAFDGVFVAENCRCRAVEHRLDANGRRKEGQDAESGGSRALRTLQRMFRAAADLLTRIVVEF